MKRGVEMPHNVESSPQHKVEIYNSEELPWDTIKEDILGVELSAFGEEEAFGEDMLERDFRDTDSVIVLMRDVKLDRIVGFTYAKPVTKTYPEDFPERVPSKDTAYVYDTALEKEYQGKGLVGSLLAKLDEELVRRGFSFVERDSANYAEGGEKETYADKIRRNYKDRIVYEESHDSEYGPQVFFRIRLVTQTQK